MAIEQINLGTAVQDGADGDVARVAFTKVNANFTDLESRKVEKVAGKQLSTEDYTSAEKMKLSGIAAGAQVNTVTSVAGKTGAVALVKGDVGLSNVDNTSDANKPVSTATQTALNLKANASTQIIAGTGLTGGGTLAANRTLTVSYGTTAGTATQGNDSRLSDAREWTAETVSQAEAEAGTATTRRAWTAQRVRQAIVAWWNGSAAKTQLDAASSGITSLQASKLDATGNAATATRLAAPRAINGVSFDGTADIQVTSLPVTSRAEGYSADSATLNGVDIWARTGVNIPYSASKIWTFGDASWPTQLGFDAYTGRMSIRTRAFVNGAWTAWKPVYTSDNPQPNVLATFTLATLPSAAANPRLQVYCSDLTGQPAPVFSDGTNWRRVSDNTIAN